VPPGATDASSTGRKRWCRLGHRSGRDWRVYADGVRLLPAVRLATADDAEAVADTLADAFMGYAWTDWAIPGDGRRARLRRLHLLFSGLVGASTGTTWLTDDLAAVAQWIPPSGFRVPPDLGERIAQEEPALFGDRMARVEALDERTRQERPAEPHWWLATVGVRPERRREGLGAHVLSPVLQQLDARREIAALETSSEGTVEFYERLGFRVSAAYPSPDGALPVWVMVRRPPGR
jgi:GNAT superfamily N-acetyltransferase